MLISAQLGVKKLMQASSHFYQKFRQKKKKMAACLIFIWNDAIFHTPFTFYTGSVFNRDNIQSANVCVCLHRFAPLNCPAPLEKKKKLTLPTTIMPCRKWLTNGWPSSQLEFDTVGGNDCVITLHSEMCTEIFYSCRHSAFA